MYQQTTIVGHLGADPELRSVSSGDQVCNFTVAVTRKWTNKDGDKKEETTWYKVTVWNKQAENCAKYLEKGRKVFCQGKVKAEGWKDREGNSRASLVLTANIVLFLSERESGGSSSSRSRSTSSRPSKNQTDQSGFDDDDDGDIPF